MSAFQQSLTPSPSPPPTSLTASRLWKKPRQDVAKHTRSSSIPPSMFLNVPKTAAFGLVTPPDTPEKNEHATAPTTEIDCPVSKASFLLAQASLATKMSGGLSTTEFKFWSPSPLPVGSQTLRFGKGLDGCFNRTNGFLGGEAQVLPKSLEAWEAVHGSLPRLLRAGRLRQAVDSLGCPAAGGRSPWDELEQRHLARAALVLSALAHAYKYGENQSKNKDDNGRPQLPCHILEPWERVCKELRRAFTGRVPADDVLNNALGNASFNLSSTWFDLPEERLSPGLQGTMEATFAPALSSMALAQSSVLANQPGQVARCLESLAARVVKLAQVFEAMTPRDTAHFDPVVWIKTYPAIGHAVMPGELGNSGVDAPLFHALDVFIGRQDVKGDLRGMQNDRRATLPANIRAFLDALGDRTASVRDYVAAARARQLDEHLPREQRSQYRRLSAAWDGLLQMYVWFLERHRVKAVGITGVTLNTGRHSTSSGVKSEDQGKPGTEVGKPKIRPEAMLSMQMKKGMASRLGGRPQWQDARVESQIEYEGSVEVSIRLDTNLPLEPGDRVQVWPPRKRKILRRMSSHKRRLQASPSPASEDREASSSVSENDAEPRFYSIARVIPDAADGATDSGEGGGGMTITLIVGQHSPEGLVSSFLGGAAPGTHLRLRPWPFPRFRQPRDLTVPLVLVGQSTGVGSLVGFLHERVARAQRLDKSQHDIGEVQLLVAAKTLRHVPCSLESLEQLTKALPLTVVLALSQESHLMVRDGTWTRLPQGKRHLTRHLVDYRDTVQRLVKEKGGHVFVCGSCDFGATVMRSLGLGQPRQRQRQRQRQQQQEEQQQQAQDANDDFYNINYTEIPSPPAYWGQLHQDLFTTVNRPSLSRSSSCSSVHCSSSSSKRPEDTPISPFELAAHNSITSCWTAIDGTVYDMTPFLSMHPGGPKTLLESAGTIADQRFAETHGGPHAQEIRGYLRSFAIGRLSTAIGHSGEQTTPAKLLDALVRMQNALTNNTAFDASRGPIPLYVYEDALLVFADGLDGVVGILSGNAAAVSASEMKKTVEDTQARLRESFTILKDRCKSYLAAAGSSPFSSILFDESERLVQKLHMEVIWKVHAAIDAFKNGLKGTQAEASFGSTDGICDACNDEYLDALKRALEKFCIGLTVLTEEIGQRTLCLEKHICAK